MSGVRVEERCACGASLTVADMASTQAIEQINEWRKQHTCPPRTHGYGQIRYGEGGGVIGGSGGRGGAA